MTLAEIQAAHAAGKVVHWKNSGYVITGKDPDNLLVTFAGNGHSIGLSTAKDPLNGHQEEDFFIREKPPEVIDDSWGAYKSPAETQQIVQHRKRR